MTDVSQLAAEREALARVYLRFARRGRDVIATQRQETDTPNATEADRPVTSGAGAAPTTEADAEGE